MSKTATFTTKKVDTAPLKITVCIPPENPVLKGYFTGNAIIRDKPTIKAFQERCENEEVPEEEVLRWMYIGFDGLANDAGYCEGEAAFSEILTGVNSAYLTHAAAQAYWIQYGEARQGNFKKRHGR